MMVREKKRECWKKFCKESEGKNPWEVVKWTKDQWRIREVMKYLQDIDNTLLKTDEEKAKGLIRDHLVWNEEERKIEEEEEKVEDEEVEEEALNVIVTKVEIALSEIQNSSAPSLDSISYRFIRMIKDTILGEIILEEVARNLMKGIMHKK